MKRWWLFIVALALLVWPLSLAQARGGGGGGMAGTGCAIGARGGQCLGTQQGDRLRLRDGSCQGQGTRTQDQDRTQEQDRTRDRTRGRDRDRTRDGRNL